MAKGLERYSRQTILLQIGMEGQERLSRGRVVVIGAGALGCVTSTMLARAGIGNIRIADRDIVEIDNIQRQILFEEKDVGEAKALVAMRKLNSMNSDIKVEGLAKDVNFSSVLSIVKGANAVLDGTDNMETRFLVNDACVKLGIPFIYGGAISTNGMSMAILPKKTACLRCLIPEMPRPGSLPTCDTAGILNTVPNVIASIQATQAMKIILGEEVDTSLLTYDAWTNEFNKILISRKKNCKCCSKGNYEFLEARKMKIVTALCGRNTISIDPLEKGEISIPALAEKLRKLGDVKGREEILAFQIGSYSMTIFKDGRALIKGTEDENKAKSLYSKYIGH